MYNYSNVEPEQAETWWSMNVKLVARLAQAHPNNDSDLDPDNIM